MIEKIFCAVTICCAAALPVSAVEPPDTVPCRHHFVSVSPLSLLTGALAGNYEFVLGRHGFVVEGAYSLPILQKAHEAYVAYRFHFSRTVRSSFCGPYFRTGFISQDVKNTDRSTYTYELRYSTAGLDWGKRGYFWKKHGILYTYRIGVGYPLYTIDWKGARPDAIGGMQTSTFESIIKISAYLDAELTIGVNF